MKKLALILLCFVASMAYAQKIRLIEGDLSPLKGQTAIKTSFTYDNMTIGKDGLSEEKYIADKKVKLDEKEAGRGAKWEKTWTEDRKARFEPEFRELFAKHSEISTVGENAKYTLIFKTTRTEPGWNVGIMRVPAYIDAEAWIVESSNPSKIIAKLTVMKAPGRDAMGFDYETGARLQEAYAKAGKSLGGYIRKQNK